jgi:MFS family permease
MNARHTFMHRPGYAWVIVAAGCLVIFACIGLARFAYGMVLPSMGKGLALGYDRMGYVSTGNFVGYLLGVAAAPRLLARFGGRRTIGAGLLLIAACMGGIALAENFATVFLLYLLTGLGSGLGNVPVMVVVGRWFRRSLRGRATGFMLAGNSFAIIFAGFLVPRMSELFGADGWRASWGTLAAVVLAVAVLAYSLLRDSPGELGLDPAGPPDSGTPGGSHPAAHPPPGGGRATLFHLSALYFAFGVTHVIYTTFLVTSLVAERNMAEASAGVFWAWVGAFGILSGPIFGTLSDRFGRRWGLAAVFAVQTAAYLLVSLGTGKGALFASIGLFGLAAWAVPTIIGAAVADSFTPERAAGAFSFVTFCLALGQILGPSIAGNLAQTTHTFSTAFLAASAVTALAAVGAVAFRPGRNTGPATPTPR